MEGEIMLRARELSVLPKKSMILLGASPIMTHPKTMIGLDKRDIRFLPIVPDSAPPKGPENTQTIQNMDATNNKIQFHKKILIKINITKP